MGAVFRPSSFCPYKLVTMDTVTRLRQQRAWTFILAGIVVAAAMGCLRLLFYDGPLGLYILAWAVATASAGVAIQRAYSQAIGLAARLRHLQALATSPASARDTRAVIEKLGESMRALYGLNMIAYQLYDEAGNPGPAQPVSVEVADEHRRSVEQLMDLSAEDAAKSGGPIVHAARDLDEAQRAPLRAMGGEAFVLLPLIERGMVCFVSPGSHVSESSRQSMAAFGEQAAIALRAVELHEGRARLVQQAALEKAALAAENARLSALEQECREQVRLLTNFKTGLTYSVSHEIRTSLAAMKAATELLLEGNVEWGTENFNRLLQSIARNVARQEALVSNILDIASLENAAVSLNLERLDVASLVADATGLVIPLMNRRGQALSLSVAAELPPLMADRQRVSQVLVNLLSNANKYAPAGSEVVLSVEARDGQMVFTVADSGPGVPPEERQRIFEPFYRARRGSDVGAPGTGLGLAIASSLVKLHGGSIWVEDSPTGGAAFKFTLPIDGK